MPAIKYQKICVATDFSKTAAAALQHGVELAKRLHAELHLLHVLPELDLMLSRPRNVIGGEGLDELLTRLESEAVALLATMPRKVDGLPVVRSVRRGVADVEICRYAEQHDIDLLVLGTHGHSGITHVLLGSISERVVGRSPCPVLLARQQQPRRRSKPRRR